MKIALLGNGNIGRPVFDIIYNKEGKFFKDNDIEIKYVLIIFRLNNYLNFIGF